MTPQLTALLLYGLPGIVLGQVAPPAIVPAYATPQGLSFDPPDSVNWAALTPDSLRPDALASNSARRDQLFQARNEDGTTELSFHLPMPANARSRHYYLADSAGVLPFLPGKLVGVVRIYWRDGTATIERTQVFGHMEYPLPLGRGAGFVVSAPAPLTLVLHPSAHTADQLLSPHGETYPNRGTGFWVMIRQYELEESGSVYLRWVWVQWRADTANLEAGCQYRFSLFKLNAPVAEVASVSDGCDV